MIDMSNFGSPKTRPSAVLDAFVAGIKNSAPAAAPTANHARRQFDGRATEHALASRSLTAAARAFRLVLDRDAKTQPITTGESAFDELQFVSALGLDAGMEGIRQPLMIALDRACEKLGPFPGGRLAPVRAPNAPVALATEVQPTEKDLLAIAVASGEAMGEAITRGALNPQALLKILALSINKGADDRAVTGITLV